MRGYFGIGIFQPKTHENIGTLWRSAYQLGASFIFEIGRRYKKQASDTYKTYRHIPLFQFKDFETFKKSLYDCRLVCIEIDEEAKKIKDFQHPHICVYLLGSEDNGLPPKILKDNIIIELPYVRQASFNVAVSGSIVMYDRLNKLKYHLN